MASFSSAFPGPEDRGTRHPSAAPEAPPAFQPADLGEELAAGQSARQQEIASNIYARLKGGADVDDVRDLIGELSRTATEEARNRRRRDTAAPRNHGRLGG